MRRAGLLFAAVAAAASLQAQIALTPTTETIELDGAQLREQVMPDGQTKIHFSLPEGWQVVSGLPGAMVLGDTVNGGTIKVFALNGEVPATFAALRGILSTRPLPPGSTVTGAAGDFVPAPVLAQMPTWENTTTYSFVQRERIRSTLVLPLKKSQLHFVVDEAAEKFGAVHAQLMGLLYSLYWEDTSVLAPGPMAGDPSGTPPAAPVPPR